MSDFYNINIIPKILKYFKINNIIISGLNDEKILNAILNYKIPTTSINHIEFGDINTVKDNPLNVLPKLKNYDAIFIDDDANWYTVFNELKIIKKNNDNFPLVFICNNKFPNTRRDSYFDPNLIPNKFRHEYTDEIPIFYHDEKITIFDGHYHAIHENGDKNGVLTAIDDFLLENNHIGIMNINIIDQITVLYHKSQLNQKRISSIIKKSSEYKIDDVDLTEKIMENNLLLSNIHKFNISNSDLNQLTLEGNKKDSIINGYEKKFRSQKNEIDFKDSQINSIGSKLDLKDSQIKNLESKLINRDIKINSLQNELNQLNDSFRKSESEFNTQLDLSNKEILDVKKSYNDRNEEYKRQNTIANSQINFLKDTLSKKEDDYLKLETEFKTQMKNNNEDIDAKNLSINLKDNQLKIKQQEIQDKQLEIDSLNFKLNDANKKEVELLNLIRIKDSELVKKDTQIEQKQKELKNKDEEVMFLERQNINQLAKLDNEKYCIHCFKEKIYNNHFEIQYIKNNQLIKKILTPLSYFYLIIKSNPKEIFLNIKLYNALKKSNCFDIGYYLNKNKDLLESKWFKYFSLELHYVCNGFDEGRTFNKKYFNRTSKKNLLEYILKCD